MSRWTILVTTPARTWPVALPAHRSLAVGRGPGVAVDLDGEGPEGRLLSLAAREAAVLLQVQRPAAVLVNDIPVTGRLALRGGDQLQVGEAQVLLCGLPESPSLIPHLASPDEWMRCVHTEVRRAGAHRPVGVVAIIPPTLNVAARAAFTARVVEDTAVRGITAVWGELSTDILAGLLLDASAEALHEHFARIPAAAGPRARVATASTLEHGPDAEALIEGLWRGLLPGRGDHVEPVVEDPVMVRLHALVDDLASTRHSVCVVGPSGCGRRTLLTRMIAAARAEVVEVSGFDRPAVERALQRTSGWVLIRDADAAADLSLRGEARVLATSHAPLAGFPAVIPVPPLRARPQDIPALAEHFLDQARVALARPRLQLGAEARIQLSAWAWPGHVRELKNVMFRAARAAVRDEIGGDSLPSWFTTTARAEGLRSALQAAERDLLLEALARTRWNVTAAASRLGVPRRTVVYRMGKLGLRRPAR